MKLNIFSKLLILLSFILFPVVLLYGYSNWTSVNVIKTQIQELNYNRLSFFMDQVESNTDQIAVLTSVFARDYSVQSLQARNNFSTYNEISSLNAVEHKLRLQQLASQWKNQIVLYYPQAGLIVPNNLVSKESFRLKDIITNKPKMWVYEKAEGGANTGYQFTHYVVDNYSDDPGEILQVTKAYFSTKILTDMLHEFNQNKAGETFLYHPVHGDLSNPDQPVRHKAQLMQLLRTKPLESMRNQTVEFEGQAYMVNALKSDNLDWYLMDVVPINSILSPITQNRNLFYSSIAVLLLLGTLASMWLYRNVQVPIKELLMAFRRMRHGDYSVRVERATGGEFDDLFSGFNYMADETQHLIEKVYTEQLQSKEAKLKQLQSQINPHFLYNCLFYIMNMATLKDEEAVVAMSLNLGEYFRYTTRNENQRATVEEEMKLVQNYLAIQHLRMQRLEYEIKVPESMLGLEIPRLSLQPIVENSVIHGIEPQIGDGRITITGVKEGEDNRIIVEDNGVGMSEEALEALLDKIHGSHHEEMGYGVWNVHQRLIYRFGEDAGLAIERSETGGMRFVLQWRDNETIDKDRQE
ncbi:sensor histidine kinase [Paenibacillus swuensis]|uniref:sensor histidine kinase n=1 Tax=Paenibacillus swuensis TaxID=1178515 RepID=UPI0018D35BD7|nr:sensor histidine kinase [Paenibacillus swuensis]